MKIAGLQKTSLTDFPGRVAAIVFTAGCGLRCPYCHNSNLINADGRLSRADVVDVLRDRADVLDGVVITGGEPTRQPHLAAFVEDIRDLGLAVKLDTNGTRPDLLDSLLKRLDYVAMDVKTSPERYDRLGADVGRRVQRSVETIRDAEVDHEFRLTFDAAVVRPEDLKRILELVGDSPLYVQPVETDHVLDPDRVKGTPDDPLELIRDTCETVDAELYLRQ
ncbi:MAG: anaerobic ribonucleoside-triphosphate reductase activating protein [Halapricum sp.]